MLLLAVFTFRSWCLLLFVVLLCELGTQVPPPQGGLLAVPCGQARHTAVPDPH